jgi:hypothetical protein
MIDTLDAHELVKDLKASGFTDAQAEAVTRAVRASQDLDLSSLAAKSDLAELRLEIERVRLEMAALGARLINWVIGAGVAAVISLTGVICAATEILAHAPAP